MKDVKRYDMEKEYSLDILVTPIEKNDGAFVNYEDYAALQQQFNEMAAENAEIDAIRIDCLYIADDEFEKLSPTVKSMISRIAQLKSPNTDAFLLNAQADGVDKFAAKQKEMAINSHGEVRHSYVGSCRDAKNMAYKLRSQAEELQKGGE